MHVCKYMTQASPYLNHLKSIYHGKNDRQKGEEHGELRDVWTGTEVPCTVPSVQRAGLSEVVRIWGWIGTDQNCRNHWGETLENADIMGIEWKYMGI